MTENFQPSATARAETNLIDTVAEFYKAFHTYRRLAEEHLGLSFDEFLQASQAERLPFDEFLQASQAERLPFDERTGPGWLTEEKYRDILERMQLYLDAYEETQQKVGEVLAEGPPDGFDELEDAGIAEAGELMTEFDLDDIVESHVAELAEELDFSP